MATFYKIEDGQTVFFSGNVLYTDTATIINPSDEVMLENGWLEYTQPEPTAAELLAMAKQNKIYDIEDYDATREQFLINGQQMWLGHELRQQLKTSVEAYISTGATQVTKWFNGQEFTFPCNVWLQMLALLEIYAAEVLNTTESHKAAVGALTTVEAIDEYDITAGYPQTLSFTPDVLAQLNK